MNLQTGLSMEGRKFLKVREDMFKRWKSLYEVLKVQKNVPEEKSLKKADNP